MDDPTISPPKSFPLPKSPLYSLRDTPDAGRGVFATNTIPVNTLIHSTSATTATNPGLKTDLSPLAWLIQRPYRKEVCAHCWSYNRGREWKVKVEGRDCGVVFCRESCREAWLERNGDVGVRAWEAVESGVKGMLKRNANGGLRDVEMSDVGNGDKDGAEDGKNGCSSMSQMEVDLGWEQARFIGEVVVSARAKDRPGKNERKVVRNVVEDGGDPDLMYYLLTAVIAAYNVAAGLNSANFSGTSDYQHPSTTIETSEYSSSDAAKPTPPISTLLHPLFTLTPALSAYNAAHTSLALYTRSYLFLHAHIPATLQPYLTPDLAHNLNTRAAHNAFSIRPPPSQDGGDSGEFLGWAVFPSASFFNHSCAPNLRKERRGRVWEFWTERVVSAGEELCITYLGGEEETLGVVERRARLAGEWGFVCGCARCLRESGEGG